MTKNLEHLPANSGQTPSEATALQTASSVMSMEQLNEYLVKRVGVICEYVRKNRTGGHTSDILPPICYGDAT